MFISLNETYADFKTNWKMPKFVKKKSKITNNPTRKGKFHCCYFDAVLLLSMCLYFIVENLLHVQCSVFSEFLFFPLAIQVKHFPYC